jgi:phosphotransferase family enzyme
VTAGLLAPDPVLVRRDELLDADALLPRLSEVLRVDAASCVRVRATYHPRRSLRALLRVGVGGATVWISARMFARGAGAVRYARARAVLGDAVVHDAELEALFFLFPADRKLPALPRLMERMWPRVGGAPIASVRLAGYAPERAATVAASDERGHRRAFVKVLAGDTAARAAAAHRALHGRGVRCPALLETWPSLNAIALEPLVGASPDGDGGSWHAFGRELARLHSGAPLDERRTRRFEAAGLDRAAATIGTACPAAAEPALALAEALRASAPGALPTVCLHGDPHPKNALVDDAGAQLVDLDDIAAGPAAADLGSALAGLRFDEVLGRRNRTCAAALLAGYGERATLPSAHEVRWHTAAALLAERAVRSITRVREPGIERLDAVLAAGLEELG